MPKTATPTSCPCGYPFAYPACCGRYHAGTPAPDAEALMRSRYCAYVLADAPYLLATWHASTRPETLAFPAAGQTRWLGLEIRGHQRLSATSARVEFVARHRIGGGRALRLHETSDFLFEDGRWFYLDGRFH